MAIQIFDYAADNLNYDRNPAMKVQIPKNAPKSSRRALTKEEISWVVNSIHNARLPALIMIFCGLRAGELMPLQWTDIDFNNALLPVRKSVERVSPNKYGIKNGTKNGKSRIVPIPCDVLREIEAYRDKSDSRFICSKADGDLHTPSSWRRLWESFNTAVSHNYATLEQAQRSIYDPRGVRKRVEKITPHMFRYTYATLLYCSGVDVLSAQKLMGHSNVSTTLSIYTHLEESKMDISITSFCDYIAPYFNS